MPELESSHEEADTRLIFHAAHAARSGVKCVIITAEDTDVFILGIAFSPRIQAPLFQKHRTNTRTCFIDIRGIVTTYGPDVCEHMHSQVVTLSVVLQAKAKFRH